VRRVYNCFRCRKWFGEAKTEKRIGEVEVCPFCGQRVYQARGIKATLVCLWWWLKELFLSAGSGPTARR